MCPQTARALLPKAKQDSRGFQNIPETEQNTRSKKCTMLFKAGQKEHFGDSLKPCSWRPRACWAPPDAAEEGQFMRKGEGPICAAPQEKALLSHTKQEKSVFVAQLSLSTTKWAKAFKHSKKKRRTCENATKETPPKTLPQQIKNQTKPKINAIREQLQC